MIAIVVLTVEAIILVAAVDVGVMLVRQGRRHHAEMEVYFEERRPLTPQEIIDATNKSRELLNEFLTPTQRKQLTQGKRIKVVGSNGKKYEIDPDSPVYNVHRGSARYCAVAHHRYWPLPRYDQVLAQMLMIQTDAAKFELIANERS